MIFEELKAFFNNEIVRLEEELNNYKNKQDDYRVLTTISSFLESQDLEICQNIINHNLINNDSNFNIKDDFEKINDLENLIINMKDNILSLDDLEFEKTLNNLEISLEKKSEIKKNFQTFKSLKPYISHVDYNDTAVKQMVDNGIKEIIETFEYHKNQLLNKFINSLKSFYDKYILEFNNINNDIERVQKEINIIKSYNQLFDINSQIIQFKNEEELNSFLDYLKNSSLSIELQIQIIMEISKFNLNYLNKLKEQKNDDIDVIVETNLQTVNSQLKSPKKDKIDAIVVENVVNDTLTEEEKIILEKINEIISLHSNYVLEESVDIFEGDFDIESRELVYYVNNKLDWNVIISDLKKNLLPNVETNKIECFKVLKYICNCYDKEIIQEQRKALLKDLVLGVDEIKKEQGTIIDEYIINKDYYDWIVEESKNDISDIETHLKSVGKTLDWLNLGYLLVNQLTKYQSDLNNYILNGNITEELVKKLTDEFHSLINLYKVELNKIEQAEKNEEIEDLEEIDEISIGNKNIIFFLDEIPDNLSNDLKNELCKTIKDCSNKSIRELWARKNRLEYLKKTRESGKEERYNEPHCEMLRYAGKKDSRTGIINFRICKENKEKLIKRYALAPDFAIFAITKPIKCVRADHSEYKHLNEYVVKNIERINQIGRLFNDPNTKEELLFEIIDQGMNICQNLVNEYQNVGGVK